MPLVGIALLWFAYTLEWYGWLTYETAYLPPQNDTNNKPISLFTSLIIPSRKNNVLIMVEAAQNSAFANATTASSVSGVPNSGNTGAVSPTTTLV